MATKEQSLERERIKALGELLIAECRADEPNFDTLRSLCVNGADVCYKHAAALHWAVKGNKYPLVSFLIDNGILNEQVSISLIANMCNNKGFNEQTEPKFFEVLDSVRRATGGGSIDVFVPYINAMAVAGRLDKLRELGKRYFLSESEIANAIYIRIIFEIVLSAHDEMLDFINSRVNWQTAEALDLAVSGGDWVVLEYLLGGGKVTATPGESAVSHAIVGGFAEVLDILLHCGYSFNRNPKFLKQASRAAFNDGGRMLEYLLNHGYTILDKYDNATLRENAIADGNNAALGVLDKYAAR